MKTSLFILSALFISSCSSALPKEHSDLKGFKDSELSVKQVLDESYQNLKKSEAYLNESKQVLKEVKDIEQNILLEKKSSLDALNQAKKERAEAEKARKRAAAQRRKIQQEEKALKEATPAPTIAPTPLPYSKSDAP
jgi:hypothetical protein